MAEHFTEDRWFDLVRDMLPAADAAALRQHLDDGCEPCRESFQLWQMVVEVANSEVRSQVPEAVVRTSRLAYQEWRRVYLLPQRARMARLVFDTLLAPLPSAVRSEGASLHQIVWKAGRWCCELRLELQAGKRVFLRGQIFSPGGQAGLLVLLLSTSALVAETTVNQFGEFQLKFGQANGLRMYFDVPGNRPVGIKLPDLESPLTSE